MTSFLQLLQYPFSLKYFFVHSSMQCFEVPKKRLSMTVYLIGLKYGKSIIAEYLTPCLFSIIFCCDFVQAFKTFVYELRCHDLAMLKYHTQSSLVFHQMKQLESISCSCCNHVKK